MIVGVNGVNVGSGDWGMFGCGFWWMRAALSGRSSRSSAEPSAKNECRTSPSSMGYGWLCFESKLGKRRLTPVPARWREFGDEEIARLLARATPVNQKRDSGGVPRIARPWRRARGSRAERTSPSLASPNSQRETAPPFAGAPFTSTLNPITQELADYGLGFGVGFALVRSIDSTPRRSACTPEERRPRARATRESSPHPPSARRNPNSKSLKPSMVFARSSEAVCVSSRVCGLVSWRRFSIARSNSAVGMPLPASSCRSASASASRCALRG